MQTFHPSVLESLSNPTLTNGEAEPILEALRLLQSRLNALPSLSDLEVVLVPSEASRVRKSTSLCCCAAHPLISSQQ